VPLYSDSKVILKDLIESSLKIAGKASVDFGGIVSNVKE